MYVKGDTYKFEIDETYRHVIEGEHFQDIRLLDESAAPLPFIPLKRLNAATISDEYVQSDRQL